MVCVLNCPVAIDVMNRAPEETINRKSPSKHARTGMVGAVPTTGGTGTQRGPVRCLYGLHTGKGAGHVPRPHRAPYSARTVARMGPYRFVRTGPRTVLPVPVPYLLFCPCRSRTVLPVPVPYRFCPHVALNSLAWSRLLAPVVFKLLHPFLSFLTSSFGLPVLSTIFHSINSHHDTSVLQAPLLTAYFYYLTSHSAVFIYNTALLYIVLLALCGHLQTQRVCRALHPVSGEDGILVAEVHRGVQHASLARTSPRRVVGLARPSQSAGRALP